jgi:hypothetical protein
MFPAEALRVDEVFQSITKVMEVVRERDEIIDPRRWGGPFHDTALRSASCLRRPAALVGLPLVRALLDEPG